MGLDGLGQNGVMLGTLVKALRILELFTVQRPQWGVTEISKTLKLNKSAVFRIMQTLEKKGYLKKDPREKRYTLTAKFLALGTVVMSQLSILQQAKNEIDHLWDRTQGTVVIRVLEGSELVTVAIRESPQALRVSHPLGSAVNFNYGAIGKAILAYLPQDEVHQLLKKNPLNKYTSKTILSATSFLDELRQVPRKGYAFSDGEAIEGVRAVGAPIFDISGRPFAGISVGLPLFRLPKSKVPQLGKLVRQAADRISLNLGFNKNLSSFSQLPPP
jgi:DNA-binding IclR family transcriptional regulator